MPRALLAAATGASLKELMARLGHSSTRAAVIYQHATRDRDQAIARALGGLVQQARATTPNPPEERVLRSPAVLMMAYLALVVVCGRFASGVSILPLLIAVLLAVFATRGSRSARVVMTSYIQPCWSACRVRRRGLAARTAPQPRAGQEGRTQLAMITIPARQSTTRPGVSPRGAMILWARLTCSSPAIAARPCRAGAPGAA